MKSVAKATIAKEYCNGQISMEKRKWKARHGRVNWETGTYVDEGEKDEGEGVKVGYVCVTENNVATTRKHDR